MNCPTLRVVVPTRFLSLCVVGFAIPLLIASLGRIPGNLGNTIRSIQVRLGKDTDAVMQHAYPQYTCRIMQIAHVSTPT